MKHSKFTNRNVKRTAAVILAAVSCFSLAAMPQSAAIFRECTITASASSDKYTADTAVLTAGNSAYSSGSSYSSWYSPNRRFELILNGLGNLYIYDTAENRITWQTNTGISYNYNTDSFSLTLKNDGTLALYQTHRYAHSGYEIWNANSATGATSNNYSLRLANDGELYVYSADRKQSLFSTKSEITCTASANTCLRSSQCLTSPNRNYRAIMQCDGNFVVYNRKDGKDTPIWDTKSAGNGGAFLALQQDGNLVLYNSSNKPLWSSGTNLRPFADYKLSLNNSGVLTLTRKYDNKVRWTSTGGRVSTNEVADAQYRVKSQFQYSSIDDAAKDFILAYNGMSVAQNREYGSTINKLDNNKYVFRHICWGAVRYDGNGDTGDDWCYWDDTVAYVHTHGRITVTANRYFSIEDINMVNNDNIYQYAYLGNANGEVYKYTKNQAYSNYLVTYTPSGTVIDTNKAKYVTNFSYDGTITSRQNSGYGSYFYG